MHRDVLHHVENNNDLKSNHDNPSYLFVILFALRFIVQLERTILFPAQDEYEISILEHLVHIKNFQQLMQGFPP